MTVACEPEPGILKLKCRGHVGAGSDGQASGELLVGRLPARRPLSPDAILDEIGDAADHYYRALWDGCARDEQVTLRQLADEGLVNPNNQASAGRLLRARLVRRDGSIMCLMNESFRRFVLCASPATRIAAWEHQGVSIPWGSLAASCLTVALGLGGLLLLTQQQLVDAWMNYLPALAPTIPSVWKLMAGGQRNAKGALAWHDGVLSRQRSPSSFGRRKCFRTQP